MCERERAVRRALRGGCAAMLAGLALGCVDTGPPPSVILYVIDTLRSDALGSYGNTSVSTPNLDRFAQESTLFENAFANSSWTRASMGSILTGRYPARHGAQNRAGVLRDGVDSVAEVLSRQGYATGFISTNPNVAACFGFDQGFDEMRELYIRRPRAQQTFALSLPGAFQQLITPSDTATRAALEWIDQASRPFFLVLHTIDPHDPYTPPARFEPDASDYQGKVTGDARTFANRRLRPAERSLIHSLYLGEVSFNDDSFGVLLSELEERGLLDESLIIVTADHGEEFWEYHPMVRGHGHALNEVQLRVPLIVRFPGSDRVSAGRRDPRPVELVDLLPTILDLLGLPAAEGVDGVSLFAEPSTPREPLYASLDLDRARMRAVIDYPYKLVKNASRREYHLYDLTVRRKAGVPADLLPLEGRKEIRRRLRDVLDARIEELRSEVAATPADTAPREVPDAVNDALRELGYVE